MDVLEELAKHTPSFIWGGLAFWALYLFRTPITALFPRLRAFKAASVEMSFAERTMAKAADAANRHNRLVSDAAGAARRDEQMVASTVQKHQVEVTRSDRERVLARAEGSVEVLRGKRILWLDDLVANNRLGREMLKAFGLKIEQVQSNQAALAALERDGSAYHLIISDIARDGGGPDGLAFLAAYRDGGGDLPVIFYVSVVAVDKPLPTGAFGLTNRPDQLLHLVIDALERNA